MTSAKLTTKQTQIRFTIPEIMRKELDIIKQEYQYLNDVELIKVLLGKIIKIEIGRKEKIDLEPTLQDLTIHNAKIFGLGEDWQSEPDNIDYTKAYPFDPSLYF
jgi:hypothetical protein